MKTKLSKPIRMLGEITVQVLDVSGELFLKQSLGEMGDSKGFTMDVAASMPNGDLIFTTKKRTYLVSLSSIGRKLAEKFEGV